MFKHSIRFYADLTCALYYISGTIYLNLFIENDDRGCLLLSGLLSGICLWTKAESLVLIAINTLVLLGWLIKNKRIKFIGYFSVFPLVYGLSWWLYTKFILKIHIPHLSNWQDSISEPIWPRCSFILQYMLQKINARHYWGLIFPVFLISIIFRYKHLKKAAFYITIIFSDIIILAILYYLYQTGSLSKFMHSTIQREYLHFFPLLIFALALINGEIIDKIIPSKLDKKS